MFRNGYSSEDGISRLHLVLALVVWLVTIGVQYGLTKAQLDESQRRLNALESHVEQNTVQRIEYEARQKDILDRLARIENKLDRNLRSGGQQ